MSYHGKAYAQREKWDANRAAGPKRRGWNPNWKKEAPVARGSAYKPILNPSGQQVAIFDHVRESTKSLIVIARAGTGKTATSVETMVSHMSRNKDIAYFIFANRNAREAESKTPAYIHVQTCHAFGLSILKKALNLKGDCVDGYGEKSRNIAQALIGPEDEKLELRFNLAKAMDLAKGYLCDNVEKVIEVCDKHEIEFGDMNEADFAGKVLEGLDLAAKQYARVEFSDMIWLPIRLGLTIPKFDHVVADECQDLNPARRELILGAINPRGGKLLGVGDDRQAIFAFTGADSNSIEILRERTNADVLSLTTTYRCGKAIVEVAKRIVPDYVAHENNPDGVVADKTEENLVAPVNKGGAGPGDFILSRTNAPLVSLCLAFVKEGRRAAIQGKDLGKNLTSMIRRSNAKGVDEFLSWLDEWQNVECERLAKKNRPSDHIVDKADCLRAFCEGQRDLGNVSRRIEEMFSDEEPGKPDTGRIVLSTVHKAKGLERDRVWVLVNTFRFEGPEEDNVWYVAVTRARTHLFMVNAGAGGGLGPAGIDGDDRPDTDAMPELSDLP